MPDDEDIYYNDDDDLETSDGVAYGGGTGG
jgi:hypothetical protein